MANLTEEVGPVVYSWKIQTAASTFTGHRFSWLASLEQTRCATLKRACLCSSRFEDRTNDHHFVAYALASTLRCGFDCKDVKVDPHRVLILPFSTISDLEANSISEQLITVVHNKLSKVDGLTCDYYRHLYLWRLARDHFAVVPNVHFESLHEALPALRLILGCILFALDSEQNKAADKIKDCDIDDSTRIGDKIISAFMKEYKQLNAIAQTWVLKLRRMYREQRPHPRFLAAEMDLSCPLDWTQVDFMDRLVSAIETDPISTKYPPSESEQAEFWAALAKVIEARDHEVHESILNHTLAASLKGGFQQLSLVADTNSETIPSAHRTFEYGSLAEGGPHARSITIRMNRDIENNVGLTSWPAGFAMGEYILDNPEIFRGKTCLELGAGIGLTAILCARLSNQTRVIATDYDLRTLENLKHNVIINQVQVLQSSGSTNSSHEKHNRLENMTIRVEKGQLSPEVKYCDRKKKLKEEEEEEEEEGRGGRGGREEEERGDGGILIERLDWADFHKQQIIDYHPDVVFACDTIYDPDLHQALAALLVDLLSPLCSPSTPTDSSAPNSSIDAKRDNPLILFAQQYRNPETFTSFIDTCEKNGLVITYLSPLPDAIGQRFPSDSLNLLRLFRVSLP